jgi:hypothetical protein
MQQQQHVHVTQAKKQRGRPKKPKTDVRFPTKPRDMAIFFFKPTIAQ